MSDQIKAIFSARMTSQSSLSPSSLCRGHAQTLFLCLSLSPQQRLFFHISLFSVFPVLSHFLCSCPSDSCATSFTVATFKSSVSSPLSSPHPWMIWMSRLLQISTILNINLIVSNFICAQISLSYQGLSLSLTAAVFIYSLLLVYQF